ncbi:MAG: DUF1015 domain-containing protein [Acidimicrobiales bacterium]|nr:DUF1015 domain-containing protein [Acidimicrobiales bacterium]
MPRFEPFPGIRYAAAPAGAATLTAPPYDVISPAERRSLVDADPHNVVRIDLPVPDGSGEDPYAAAGATWRAWRRDGTLVTDPEPTFSVYRMEVEVDGERRRTTGVIGALELSPPGEGGILPHEFTTPKAKSDRLDLLRATSANLSPVWGLSPAPGLSGLLDVGGAPDVHFTAADGVSHDLWVVSDPERRAAISAAVSAHPVVIADGHHRYETSLAYLDERRRAEPAVGGAAAVLCFVVELVEAELTVDPIHRLLTDLPPDVDLLSALQPFFALEPVSLPETGAVAFLRHQGALAVVRPEGCWLARPRAERLSGVRDLDSSRLDVALAALPSVTVTFQHGVDRVRGAVADGTAQAGVLLRPATVGQIVEIAHGADRMPPKTTFFAPKPRTGLVFRDLT